MAERNGMSFWRALRLWLSMEPCIRVTCPKCGMVSQPVDYRVAGWLARSHVCRGRENRHAA